MEDLDIDRFTTDFPFADEVMSALRKLQEGISSPKTADRAVADYLSALSEIRGTSLILGVSPESKSFRALIDVDGIFRWAVLNDNSAAVEACLTRGANHSWENHWGLIYALVHKFDDVAEAIGRFMGDGLINLERNWQIDFEAAGISNVDSDSLYIMGLVGHLRKRLFGQNIPELVSKPTTGLPKVDQQELAFA